ncbi:phosphoadenosine phosphosulfate (PAPS) reductase family protein [Artemisia annua]|uniref:FAD synthase n=1 Tax=Artemisia annua TaxID=35608 RepID=A0A2U1MI54_ARTAN|nr:phosphoadenosine phosphosulfate (PAPS) reductase family protein [Artemisia annua]
MEIDEGIKKCDDRRLKTKYNTAIYVIRRALSLYSIEELAFSFNGGKDSTVLLHLLRAGYYLHQAEHGHSNGDLSDGALALPIRTIYFETTSTFSEINSFTYETAASYGVKLDILREDFKSGLEALLKATPIRAIFLGVRIGDPTAVGQEQFSPSSPGWPPFMRVNPILDWSYRDVWAFLLTCKVPYCRLYDQGYTSIGSINDTVPNALLCVDDSTAVGKQKFRPAYMLSDGRSERAGRARRLSSSGINGQKSVDPLQTRVLTASIVAVGDEILFGIIEDQIGPLLCRKLHSIGWVVSQFATVRSEIDSVAEEVERRKSMSDMVFIYGGVGPLHSDVTVGGVAKAFGVRLAPDEEYEEYLSHLFGDKGTGNRNEMAQLPEGITELLQHEKLRVPLIKCHNVIVLTATNVDELNEEWDAMIDLRSTNLLASTGPFVSKHLTISLSDIEVAQPLSKIPFEFPDVHTGCYRKSRSGPLTITLEGKDQETVEAAMEALSKKLSSCVKQISG